MKASAFEYIRVSSVDETVAQLAEFGDEAKVLAGGQSLVPLLNLRLANPAYLVDINRLGELTFITNGSGVRVGAMARHSDVERSELVARANPLLAAAVKLIGHAPSATAGRSAAAWPTPTRRRSFRSSWWPRRGVPGRAPEGPAPLRLRTSSLPT